MLHSTASTPLNQDSLHVEVQLIVSPDKAALKHSVFWLQTCRGLAVWEE